MADIVDLLENDAISFKYRDPSAPPVEEHNSWKGAQEIKRLRARLAKYQTDETMINQELKDVRAKAASHV